MKIAWKYTDENMILPFLFLILSVYACTIVFQRQMRDRLLKIRWHASMCLTWLELSHWVLRFRRRKVSCQQLVLRTCIKQYIYIYIYISHKILWLRGRVCLVGGVEKWENRKNFNFSHFCLVESEKVDGWKKKKNFA